MGIHQSFGETNSYRGRYLPYYGINSDVEWLNGINPTQLNDAGKYELVTYAASPTNTLMNTDSNAWAKSSTKESKGPTRPLKGYATMARWMRIPAWHNCWAKLLPCVQ